MEIDEIKEDKSTEELINFGIINIDKPSGPTSFSVSEFIKKSLKLNKTSHFGTLDPRVTGVLPVALGRACKLTGYFLGEDKEYVGIARFHGGAEMRAVQRVIDGKFIGKIKQIPPVRSRVKRQEREREVYEFKLLEQDAKDILFRVSCEGGTYIRKLIDDLGKELGIGAHMLELRRVRAGIFLEKNAVNLYDFEKAIEEYQAGNDSKLREMIIPAEIVSKVYDVVQIKKDNLKQILTVKSILEKDVLDKLPAIGKIVSVFCEKRFVGMYKVLKGSLKPEFVMQPISQ